MITKEQAHKIKQLVISVYVTRQVYILTQDKCYTNKQFETACEALNKAEIDFITYIDSITKV